MYWKIYEFWKFVTKNDGFLIKFLTKGLWKPGQKIFSKNFMYIQRATILVAEGLQSHISII